MTQSPLRLLIALAAAAVLAGCASNDKKPDTLFDLGPSAARAGTPTDAPLPALVVTDATGSAALESEKMFYRLNYADPMQARPYATSRWNTNPLELVTERLKTRLAQAGTKVLEPTDAATSVPILRVQVDDFMHTFASATQSSGVIVVRASLFRGHALVDQQTFSRSSPAPSADASGGARALAASLDAVADDIAGWLARQSPAQR
ncbi:MAG: ABC-type transport auxiliary lipoprotein family protein [Telluria sp.]